MNFNQHQIDSVMQVALINFFSMSKEKEIIELKKFDINNKKHLAVLNIAVSVGSIFHRDVAVELNTVNFLRLRHKRKCYKSLKRLKTYQTEIPTTDEFIKNIEDSNKVPDIFTEIYERDKEVNK